MISTPASNSSAVDGASYSSHSTHPHNAEQGGGAGGHSTAHQAVHQRASTAYTASANSSHNGSSGSPATPPTSPSSHISGIPRPSAVPSSSAAAGSSTARREPYFSSDRAARMRAPAEEPHIGKYKLLKVWYFWKLAFLLWFANVPIYASFFIFIDSTQKFTMNIIMLIVKLLLTILLIYLNKLFPHINNEF